MYSYGPPHMAEQKRDDQLEHTYSSYVRIRDVVQKTYRRRWTIGRSGERGSEISVQAARHDDDDDISLYIYIYIYRQTKWNDSYWMEILEINWTFLWRKRTQVCFKYYQKMITNHVYLIYKSSQDLFLNSLQSLIWHKTKQTHEELFLALEQRTYVKLNGLK